MDRLFDVSIGRMAGGPRYGNFRPAIEGPFRPIWRRVRSDGSRFGTRVTDRIGGARRAGRHDRFSDFRHSRYGFRGRHIVWVPFYQSGFRRYDPALLRRFRSRIARAASA